MPQSVFDRISIPKPCHEDWNKMTPDQKGAFCKVCNKSVHDFSRKSAEEVERILLSEEDGKVCGKFSKEQLSVPKDLEIPIHLLPRSISPFRAFALAVFLVFGTALFGITDVFGQGLKGKVCIRKPSQTEQQPVKESETLKGDVAYVPEKTTPKVVETPVPAKMLKGEVVLSKPLKKDTVKTTTAKSAEPIIRTDVLGGVSFCKPVKTSTDPVKVTEIKPINDTIINGINVITGGIPGVYSDVNSGIVKIEDPLVLPDTTQKTTSKLDPDQFIMGKARIIRTIEPDPIKQDLPADTTHKQVALTVPTTEPESLFQNPPVNPISCFPNPSNGKATLSYVVHSKCYVVAQVYDVQGNLVKSLFSINDHYEGIYQSSVDLSELANGTYIIRMQIGEQVSSTRVLISH
jgi:hypothetical protein